MRRESFCSHWKKRDSSFSTALKAILKFSNETEFFSIGMAVAKVVSVVVVVVGVWMGSCKKLRGSLWGLETGALLRKKSKEETRRTRPESLPTVWPRMSGGGGGQLPMDDHGACVCNG